MNNDEIYINIQNKIENIESKIKDTDKNDKKYPVLEKMIEELKYEQKSIFFKFQNKDDNNTFYDDKILKLFIKNKSKKNMDFLYLKNQYSLKNILENYKNNDANYYNEDFYNYFEDDDNFEIYFTLEDLFKFKNNRLKSVLDILHFRKINKIIYIDEYRNIEKSEKNPFKQYQNNRVIKYYDTFEFSFYESVSTWLENQTISKKFKNQKKLIKFLEIITFYFNYENLLTSNEDSILNKKIKLNYFNPNKWKIIDKTIIEIDAHNEIEIYKNTHNILKEYISCVLQKDYEKNKSQIKNINNFARYILPMLLSSEYKNNIDFNLLIYYLNNPKDNENILLGLINKYKNIL